MDINGPTLPLSPQSNKKKLLKDQVKRVFTSQNLDNQRRLIKAIASELKISVLDCAAALATLNEGHRLEAVEEKNFKSALTDKRSSVSGLTAGQPTIRLVRYRLDLGSQHDLNVLELKKVLVEESGVDIKNIANVRIQDSYTLIDLPDEMPQEIFHHLKTVEINERKLDIRRVKPRNKKKANRRHRHSQATARPENNELSK